MAQALTAFVIFMVVAGGVIISLNRRTRTKMQESALIEGEIAAKPKDPKPRNLSKRQQRIISTLEPTNEAPSIEDLVAAEAAETGVNDIPGGDGLDVSLKLRVYWRDEVVRSGCEDGMLEFRIEDGIDPATAETEDVRLVCVRNGIEQAKPDDPSFEASNESAAATDGPDTAGNFEAGLDVD